MNKIISFKAPYQFNVGETFEEGPNSITFGETHYVKTVPLGKDHTMTLIVAESAVEENPELFRTET